MKSDSYVRSSEESTAEISNKAIVRLDIDARTFYERVLLEVTTVIEQ
jgi:hypothetical protein